MTTRPVVIDDIRFDNEAALCSHVIRLHGRGGIDGDHASEAGVTKWDVEFINDGRVNNMHKWLDYVIDLLGYGR